jgi:hypothetical protein
MEQKISGYVPKLLFKLYLKLKEQFDNKVPTPDEVKFAIEICEKLLEFTDSKLTYAPISSKRFIKNESKNIFVVIENRNINIINHSYSYSLYVENDEMYSGIIKLFDSSMERHRKELEQEMSNNIQFTLKKVLEKISTTE